MGIELLTRIVLGVGWLFLAVVVGAVYVSLARAIGSAWAPFLLIGDVVRWAMQRRHEPPAELQFSSSGRRNYLPSNAELAWDAEHRRTCRRCAREHAKIEAEVMAELAAEDRTRSVRAIAAQQALVV